jgi:hypothetical protein
MSSKHLTAKIAMTDMIFTKVYELEDGEAITILSASEVYKIAPEMFEFDLPEGDYHLFRIDGGTCYTTILPIIRSYVIPLAVLEHTLTTEQYFKIKNEELKSAIVQYVSDTDQLSWFHDEVLPAKKVDVFVDKKQLDRINNPNSMTVGVYTLYKVQDRSINLAYVQCYCPSTDRCFNLRCDPRYTNAKDAIASLARPPKALMPYIKSLSRQGECFLAYVDNKDLPAVRQLLADERKRKDVKSVSGDWYFENMVYEY